MYSVLHVYIHVCMYIYMYFYVHVCTSIIMYICMSMHVSLCVYIHGCVRVCLSMGVIFSLSPRGVNIRDVDSPRCFVVARFQINIPLL